MNPIFSLFKTDDTNKIVSKTIYLSADKWVMAVDDISKYNIGKREGYFHVFLGKLDDRKWSMRCTIFNKLLYKDWDFENCPNPDLILFTVLCVN